MCAISVFYVQSEFDMSLQTEPCLNQENTKYFLKVTQKSSCQTVAYLGFHKGAKFSLPTSAHTKGGGANQVFQMFPMVKNTFFAKGGPWPNDLP